MADLIVESEKNRLLSGLSSETKPTLDAVAGTIFKESDTGNEYEYTGTSWQLISANGAKQITTATGLGPVSPRELDISGGEATATWTVAEDVTHIIYELAGAVGDSAFVALDSIDAATQTSNLADGGTSSTPALREIIVVGKQYEKFFPKGAPLRRFGATRNGGTGTVVSIVAGK